VLAARAFSAGHYDVGSEHFAHGKQEVGAAQEFAGALAVLR
jgi:hypothetical protein